MSVGAMLSNLTSLWRNKASRNWIIQGLVVLGLVLVVLGTGLLKPNISAIVGQLYPDGGARRDAGFTIFYMGINIGAALGPLICSYLGENVD